MTMVAGENLPNSVADVAEPFPAEWLRDLRALSPVQDRHSFLVPYWYRAQSRWVLYDVMPRAAIDPDATQAPGLSGVELLAALEGPAPRDLAEWQRCPYVSDVQHQMFRVYGGYARPFWVLQGDLGGHQVQFSPWQQNVLAAKGLPTTPPAIGSLPPCPFDNRVIGQLRHLNRLHAYEDRLDKLQASGTAAGAQAEMDAIQREIREAELRFVEAQMTPIVEMVGSLRQRSEHQDQIVYTAPGSAAKAKDALDEYMTTGHFPI